MIKFYYQRLYGLYHIRLRRSDLMELCYCDSICNLLDIDCKEYKNLLCKYGGFIVTDLYGDMVYFRSITEVKLAIDQLDPYIIIQILIE